MNRFKFILFMAIIFALTFTLFGCSEDDGGGDGSMISCRTGNTCIEVSADACLELEGQKVQTCEAISSSSDGKEPSSSSGGNNISSSSEEDPIAGSSSSSDESPVKMTLKDQYPISTQKNIEVELITKDTTPWTANVEDLGVITWEEEIKAGETKTYQISYSVKYPKGSKLNL